MLETLAAPQLDKEEDEFISSRVISESEPIKVGGYELEYRYPYFEDSEKRKLYLVMDRPVQQFLTGMLLTDAVNRCQVLYDKRTGHFYSYGVEENTGPEKPMNKDEALADEFVLNNLFGIGDRGLNKYPDHNLAVSKGIAHHYDLPSVFWIALRPVDVGERRRYGELTSPQRERVNAKCDRLKEYYAGPSGKRFFQAIYDRTITCQKDAIKHPGNAYVQAPAELGPAENKYKRKLGKVNFDLELAVRREDPALFFDSFKQRIDALCALRDSLAH